MCKFKSAIVLRNGDILHNPYTDSHEDLIQLYKLDDSSEFISRFVRVEFAPPDDKDLTDVTAYVLKVDEDNTPEWFDEIRDSVAERMAEIVRPMIVNEDTDLIIGRAVVLGKINVGRFGSALVINAGYATIHNAGCATIQNAGFATIQDAGFATIQDAGFATIQDAGRATIQDAGRATIQDAGCATIQYAGYATIINKQNANIIK